MNSTMEKEVCKKLEKYDLYPFSIFYTDKAFNNEDSDISLTITFYLKVDLDNFLRFINYSSQCDKSGYIIFRKSNTVILRDLALINFYLYD